jgi:Flp pilus assembly protein TadD
MATALSPVSDGDNAPAMAGHGRSRCNAIAIAMSTGSGRRWVSGFTRSLTASALFALALAGCQSFEALSPPKEAGAATASALSSPEPDRVTERPADVKYFPSDEPLRMAVELFNQGDYGLAQRYFRDAVERAPRDVTAWVGLAASYDRLGRFDLADRAYRSAVKLGGETTQILNNEGYSYMLRGDLVRARAKFEAASRRDPENPTIANNLKLLADSSQYIDRSPQ